MPKAIRITETGGPEVLRWEDVEVGEPGPGEARVRHTAIGVNFNYYGWVASAGHLGNDFLMGFYIVAIIGASYHFANGLWAFCIDWVLTVGPKAQRAMVYASWVLFVLLAGYGTAAAIGFRMHNPHVATSSTSLGMTLDHAAAPGLDHDH